MPCNALPSEARRKSFVERSEKKVSRPAGARISSSERSEHSSTSAARKRSLERRETPFSSGASIPSCNKRRFRVRHRTREAPAPPDFALDVCDLPSSSRAGVGDPSPLSPDGQGEVSSTTSWTRTPMQWPRPSLRTRKCSIPALQGPSVPLSSFSGQETLVKCAYATRMVVAQQTDDRCLSLSAPGEYQRREEGTLSRCRGPADRSMQRVSHSSWTCRRGTAPSAALCVV